MFIYTITNDFNDLAYTGYHTGKNLIDRWDGHLASVKEGSKTYLHNSIRKYGAEKFHITSVWSGCILLTGLKELEKYYIKSFNTKCPNGYNHTDGGDGVSSEYMKELWKRPEYRALMDRRPKKNSGQFKKGYPSPRKGGHREDLTEEGLESLRIHGKLTTEYNKTTWKDPEVRKRRSEGISRRRKGQPAHNKHSQSIIDEVIRFNQLSYTQTEIAKELKISQSSVYEILRRRKKETP